MLGVVAANQTERFGPRWVLTVAARLLAVAYFAGIPFDGGLLGSLVGVLSVAALVVDVVRFEFFGTVRRSNRVVSPRTFMAVMAVQLLLFFTGVLGHMEQVALRPVFTVHARHHVTHDTSGDSWLGPYPVRVTNQPDATYFWFMQGGSLFEDHGLCYSPAAHSCRGSNLYQPKPIGGGWSAVRWEF